MLGAHLLPRRRRSLAFAFALAAVLGVLALPGAASANTTVSRSGDVVTITGDDTASHIVTTAYFTEAQFEDSLSGAVVTAGAGCAQLTASSVDCGAFGPTARVVATLGGGDDYYKIPTTSTPQEIDAGAGNDTIEAGEGNDTVLGGLGNDDLTGGRGDDTMDGGAGDDKVDGWDGSDSVTGGPGKDTLLGDGSTIYSGGNDRLYARDGEADSVDCGGGADSAQVDQLDAVAGCTQVDRSSGTPAGTPGTGDLSLVGNLATVPKLGRVLAGSSVGIRLKPTHACAARVALAVTAAEARRLKIGSKVLTLGTSRVTKLAAGRATTVTVALTRAYRRKLRKAKSVKGNLVVVCADASGATFSGSVAVRLRR